MRLMARLATALIALGGGLVLAGPSEGGQTTGTLTVNATVADACTVSDTTLSFGNVTPSAGVLVPVTVNISATCTLGTAFTVGLSDGQNVSSGQRRMRRGATTDYLKYELYKDLTMTTRFGDTGSSDRAAGVGLGVSATPIAVYGAMPGSQTVSAGNYADSVQITLYY